MRLAQSRQKELLSRQPVAALGAAGVDHSATASRAHAHQKSMSTLTANFGRMVGAFHCIALSGQKAGN
jgi:hypothetical protein